MAELASLTCQECSSMYGHDLPDLPERPPAARQHRFAAVLREANLDGALVVSCGGATADRYANVLYLTGHY